MRSDCRAIAVLALALSWWSGPAAASAEGGPQAIVRQYCRLDALGGRSSARGYAPLAQLTGWSLEPAWDEVVVIRGYTVGSPIRTASGATVEVRYQVVARVTADAIETSHRIETTQFEVGLGDRRGWLIKSPLQPPHVFAQQIDTARAQQLLRTGTRAFVPNSLLIWNLYREAGWEIGLQSTRELVDGSGFGTVEQPAPGDLAVYSRERVPYHVGVLDAEGDVVSSTLNLGTVRSTIDAFPGAVTFLRLIRPARLAAP